MFQILFGFLIAWLEGAPYNIYMFSKFFRTTLVFTCCLLSLSVTQYASASEVSQAEKELARNPDNLKLREQLAQKYMKGKDFDKVIQILAPYSNEISNEAIVNLSASYSQKEDFLNEIRTVKIYADKEPTRFRPHFLLGLAYRKNKQLDLAAKSLRSSIQFAPKHRPSYDLLLGIFLENKQNYEARVLLNDMSHMFGRQKLFSNLMCKLFTDDGFWTDALTACKNAVKFDINYPDNHVYLANVYYNQGNTPAAEKIFRTASQQFKKNEFVQYAAGEFYLNEKNFPAAVRYLQNAVNIDPNTKRGHLSLALALFESKNYTEALTHFDKSCKLDKSKETQTALKDCAAKLLNNERKVSQLYSHSAALCQN
jgi:tetratricopeptide (TPR) repeat protein